MEQRIRKILVANRGEIAVRIIRTCKKMGISTLVAYSDADKNSPAARLADEIVFLGASEPSSSYLNVKKLTNICRERGVDAVHPGYGFLSENKAFAEALKAINVTFIGPTPDVIDLMGDKVAARRHMQANNIPIVPGYDEDEQSEERFLAEARRIGYPIMIKASAGGGGRGMRRVDEESNFLENLISARREAQNAFGNDKILLEKFVENPRHVEIQVFGDTHGNIRHLFERECSLQRRHQKVIEESPSPAISPEIRQKMAETAVNAAAAVKYQGAGTVEFIFSEAKQTYYFLEMNTRLQVEHPVTELVCGVDLVEEQIKVAEGRKISFEQSDIIQKGHAIEARVYAEDPSRNFMPDSGPLHYVKWPEGPGIRIDAGYESGDEISIYYDSMAAKVITYAENRDDALDLMESALRETIFFGPRSNITFLRKLITHPDVRKGNFTTNFIADKLDELNSQEEKAGSRDLAAQTAGALIFSGVKNTEASTVHGELKGFRVW